jgi:hypothetical protein
MNKRTKLTVGAVGAVAALGIGAGVVNATAGDDDPQLRGATYERAAEAALDHVGEGEVTETEVGDSGDAYEVEVRRADGTQVEVHLDENFNVVGSAGDDDAGETEDETGEAEDD